MMDESTDRGDVKRVGMKFLKQMLLICFIVLVFKMSLAMINSLGGIVMEQVLCWEAVSVVSCLKQKQPNLYVLHCICHVSHLIVGDSIKAIPSYVIDLIETLFWWFHQSVSMNQAWLEVEAHKILKKVDIRWYVYKTV